MPGKIKFGISPLTWGNDDLPQLGDNISLDRCLKEIKNSGFDYCELSDKFPKDNDSINWLAKFHNIKIIGQWFSTYFAQEEFYDKTIKQFNDRLSFVKSVGGKVINICECSFAIHQSQQPLFANKPKLSDQEWRKLSSGLNHIGKLANENGMIIAYHYHMGTVVQSRSEIDRLMSMTDSRYVHLLLDTGHSYAAGDDPYEIANRYKRRIKHIHLKDVRVNVLNHMKKSGSSFLDGIEAGMFTIPGDGAIQFKPTLNVIQRAEYEGFIVVEADQDPAKADPFTYATRAREFLRNNVK